MDMPQQPSQPAMTGAPELEETEAGTEICLAIAADGSLSVYMEKDGAEQERQAVPDIGGGLRAILDLYKQAEAGRERNADGGQEFDQGFAGNGGRKPAQPMTAMQGGR